jgi:hypothetical protein
MFYGDHMEQKGRRFRSDPEKPKKAPPIAEAEEESTIEQEISDESPDTADADVNPPDIPEDSEHPKKADQKKDERLKKKNEKKLNKLMKKQRRREEHTDRDVLSYEDMPLEERHEKDEGKTRFKKRRVILAAVIILVVFGIVFLFANSDRLSIHNISNFLRYGVFNQDSEERFPVNVQGESISAGNFSRMGQDLVYASDVRLQVLNNYGKSLLSAQHGYTTPVLVCGDRCAMIYSLGGTGFQICSNEQKVYSGEAEHNIIVADINDDGAYALVTQSDGYLSKLYVYDRDNKQIFAYSFADYYITSVSLARDSRHAVLSGISALNGSEIASLYVLDFTREKPVYLQEYEDNILYQVSYLNDGSACAIGRSAAIVINTRSGKSEVTDYEGRTLTAFCINKDTASFHLSLSRSGDGRNCDILSFSSNGSVANSFETDLRVISLSAYKGRVALLTTDSIFLYNKNGLLVSKANAGLDPHAIVLYTSSDVYVLDTSEIRTVRL